MKKNDSVWLVGASSGIGAALAVRLLREGHPVVLSARREEAMRDVVGQAGRESEGGALVVPCDVTRVESIAAAYDRLKQEMGVPDCVIANAGTYTPTHGSKIDAAQCKEVFDVNLYGATSVITRVIPDFTKRGSGTMAAVASVAGYRGLPRAAAYCASKAGLIAFMESLRFDLEPAGVKVTIINPGFVKSRLTQKNTFRMPALITPEKSADYIYRGLLRGKKEIHYPPSFSWLMKTMRVLPYPLFEAIVRRKGRRE